MLTEELKLNKNEKTTATMRPLTLGALRVIDMIPHKTTNLTANEMNSLLMMPLISRPYIMKVEINIATKQALKLLSSNFKMLAVSFKINPETTENITEKINMIFVLF